MKIIKRTACLLIALIMLIGAAPFSARRSSAAATYKAYGIDISAWQRDTANWDQLGASGVDFIILRIGISGSKDSCFENFYTQAKARGINVGVYIYTYANTAAGAVTDANNVLNWLNGRKLEYPVYYDMEDAKQKALTNAERTAMCEAFCSTIQNAGYMAGIYTGRSWLKNNAMLDYSTLRQKYEIWMAIWHDHTEGNRDYSSECRMWQYGSKGPQQGINGNCDMDVCYFDYPTYVRSHGLNGYSSFYTDDLKFDTSDYEQLFGPTNNAAMALTDGGLSITATTASDPFGCLNNIDLSADVYKYFVFKAKTTYVGTGTQKVSFFLSAGATTYSTEQCRVDVDLPESGEYETVIVDLTELSLWTGLIHMIRIDPFNDSAGAYPGEGIVVRRLKLCRTMSEAISFTEDLKFDIPEYSELLGGTRNATAALTDDGLSIRSTSTSDPYAILDNIALSADEYKYFVFTAKTSYVGDGMHTVSFFLTSDGTKYYTEQCRADVQIPESGEYETVVVDLSGLSLWRGAIDTVRIDLFNDLYTCPNGPGIDVRRLKLCRTLEEAESYLPEPEPEPPVLLGDIDGDGSIDIKDLHALKRYLVSAGDAVLRNCDMNGDGNIDLMDIKPLKQIIAGSN